MKYKRYSIRPLYETVLGVKEEPKNLRTQYQVLNETKTRKNQKIIKNRKVELEVKKYPKKKKPIVGKIKINLSSYPSSKQNNCAKFDRGCFC